mmetsp:Transcript_55820/g.176999  ORF Transcript_55820/g.176999 Transcript_55820/m.176999 type:complete len:127 (+) Transcript_55820:170-550(+)
MEARCQQDTSKIIEMRFDRLEGKTPKECFCLSLCECTRESGEDHRPVLYRLEETETSGAGFQPGAAYLRIHTPECCLNCAALKANLKKMQLSHAALEKKVERLAASMGLAPSQKVFSPPRRGVTTV